MYGPYPLLLVCFLLFLLNDSKTLVLLLLFFFLSFFFFALSYFLLKGVWVIPCRDCQLERSCYWNKAQWQPIRCRYLQWTPRQLRQCLAHRKVVAVIFFSLFSLFLHLSISLILVFVTVIVTLIVIVITIVIIITSCAKIGTS